MKRFGLRIDSGESGPVEGDAGTRPELRFRVYNRYGMAETMYGPSSIWDSCVYLSNMLREDLLRIGLEARSKETVLGELLDIFVEAGDLPAAHRDDALAAVLRREEGKSTGLAHGIAIPHASLPFVERPLCVLGTSKDGIPFDTLDGTPADIFILLLIPQNSLQAHVRTLAGIARILNSAHLRDAIRNATTEREILDILYEAEGIDEGE